MSVQAYRGIEGLDDGVSSIGKAARVLRVLAGSGRGELGVTEIASAVGLPKSTAHRVLSELAGEGLIGRSGPRYRLGPAWFELQSALSSSEWVQLADKARRPLAGLFERTGATVHLGVLEGTQVLYLEKLTAKGGTAVPTHVGSLMPATCTALGKSLLAFTDSDVVRSIVAKPLPLVSRASVQLPHFLLRQLAEIRESGVAYDREETRPGLFCVAAPVFYEGRAIAAVSLSRVYAQGPAATDARDVRQAAREIADWLSDAEDGRRAAGWTGSALTQGPIRPVPCRQPAMTAIGAN